MSPWTLRKRAPAHPPRHLHAIVPPELLDPQRSRSADAGAGNSSRCLGAKPAASSSRESDALLTRDCFDVWCADQKSIEHASLKRVTPVLLFARRRDIVDEGSRGARLAPWRIRSDDADLAEHVLAPRNRSASLTAECTTVRPGVDSSQETQQER